MIDLSGLVPVTQWVCSHCNFRDQTREAAPHSRFHACSGLGISTPMTREGDGSRTVLVERGDYIGREQVQLTDDGRPVSSVRTEYPDGHNDTAVYAPTATMEGS